jgi:hypothetical protein
VGGGSPGEGGEEDQGEVHSLAMTRDHQKGLGRGEPLHNTAVLTNPSAQN